MAARMMRILTLALLALSACMDAPPPTDDLSQAIGTGGTGGGSLSCANVCNATSECDDPCIDPITGFGTTCGKHGVCLACSTYCGSNTACDFACQKNGTLTSCRGAGATCNACTDAVCEARGCGDYCQTATNSYQRCAAYEAPRGDKDSDGLPDLLEDALAHQFLPNIFISNLSPENNWGQFYATGWNAANRPLMRIPYVVRKVAPLTGARSGWCAQGQCAEIVYGLPYNWDTGMPDTGWEAHQGDSEHVALLVAYRRADDESNGHAWGTTWSVARTDASVWRVVGAFYSAHQCKGSFDNSTFVWPYEDGFYRKDALVDVYESDGKHAAYPSLDACNDVWDQCLYMENWRPAVLSKLFNAGDADGASPSATGYVCPGYDRTIATPASSASSAPLDSPPYDVWSGQPFGSTKADPFSHALRAGSRNWGAGTYACD